MISRRIGFALAGCLIALPATGGEEGVELSGKGELAATYLKLDDDGKEVIQGGEASDYWILGGSGALDLAWRALNLQADFSAEGTLDERSADDTFRHSFGGGLHIGWRDAELGSLGAFGSAGNLEINNANGDDPDTVVWGVGLEGQVFFEPSTLYLQAGYLDRESLSSGGDIDALKNAGFARAIGRYFCTDNCKLEAEVSYAQGKMDPDEDTVWILGWGIDFEYRPGGWPVSAFAGYTGARYDQDDDDDVLYEHRIGFGVRFYCGKATPKANDRSGVSLDLPRYLEWNGQIAGALE
ncbi:MAG: hypothetical protein JRE43_03745 [Deltaproteobacteria bacterium]|jgi:hypothetical protein|nr:hypothetical protein [Deltaproteobacteria bacterium]